MSYWELLRRLLSFLIIIELAAPRVYAANNEDTPNTDRVASELADVINDSDSKAGLRAIDEFSDKLENGDLAKENPEDYDVFKLANQRVEILKNGRIVETISLSDYRIETPAIAYTNIRTTYNKETRELIFEGVQGMLPDGTGGEVVARHIIPNMDVSGMARDNEIVSLIDSKGRLSLIDKGYAAEQVFKNPIPVVQNVWEPTYDIGEITAVEAKYITRGIQPYNDSEIDEHSVIPTNENNRPVFKAGDLLVRYKDASGRTRVLGVFSRDVSYASLRRAAMYLMSEATIVAPSEDTIKSLSEILKQIDSEEIKPEELSNSMDNVTKRFLEKLDQEQLATLQNRFESMGKYSEKRRDLFYYEEWLKTYQEIRQNQLQAIQDKEDKINKKIDLIEQSFLPFKDKLTKRYQDELADMKYQPEYTERGLQKTWSKYVTPADRKNPVDKTLFRQVSEMLTKKVFNMKLIATLLTAGGVSYVALPFVHDKFEVVQQVMTLNWMYDHYLFPVLKDQQYRVTLICSMVSLLAIWPLAHAASWAAQNILLVLQKSVGSASSKAANYIRDLSKALITIGNCQRLTSFGMRIYAFTVYPMFRAAIKYALNQKTFFTALENGLNPLQKVTPESEEGRAAGLKQSKYIGINNPFLAGDKLRDRVVKKEKLMSLLAHKQEQARQLAWILAIQTVSIKQGIDPATLIQVSSGKVDPSRLMDLIQNEQVKRDWYLISSEIYKQIKDYDMGSLDKDNVDPKLVAEFYEIAKNAADKINSYSQNRKTLAELMIKFKRLPTWAIKNAPLVAGGLNEFNFLRSIYTSPYVSGQVYKEFVLDHISMAGIYSLYGARANLSDPKNLAADPNGFIWTSKGNLYDMFFNTYAHFFVTGARAALIYQTVKAKEAEEYAPYENYYYKSDDREQGFLKGSYEWLTNTFNPTKSNLGGYAVKSFFKRWMTVQSGVVMTSFFQGLLLHRSITQAHLALGIYFFAGKWFYGWVWDPVQRGNQMEGERFELMQDALNKARYEISMGLKEENPERSKELIQNGYKQLLDLYEKYNPQALKDLAQFIEKTNTGELKFIKNIMSYYENTKFFRAAIQRLGKYRDIIGNDQLPIQEKFQQLAGKQEISPEEAVYYGLVSELAIAIKNDDRSRIENAYLQLKNYTAGKEGLDKTDIEKLSAKGLLEFSLSNPPIYTKANGVIAWLTTFGAAAGSTVLATPYSVRITNNDYITFENLTFWIGFSAVAYTLTYLTMAKAPWDLYIRKARELKEKFFPSEKKNPVLSELQKDIPVGATCSYLFY